MGLPNSGEVKGKFEQAKGRVKESIGAATDNDRLRTEGRAAVEMVRGLSDEQLDRTAPMAFAGGAEWSAADVIERVLIGHPVQHGASIQAALAS